MLLLGAPNPIMCKVFSTTLKKVGLCWFTILSAQSISNFKQLADTFCMHFATSQTPKKMLATLVNFQQGKQETLKEYLARFNSLALEIKDLNEGIVIHQIIAGLRAGHFSLSLAKKLTTSLADLLICLKKYINVEEIEMTRRQIDQN